MFTKKLFWILVIGFLNLVSVDAKERSMVKNANFGLALHFLTFHKVNIMLERCSVGSNVCGLPTLSFIFTIVDVSLIILALLQRF